MQSSPAAQLRGMPGSCLIHSLGVGKSSWGGGDIKGNPPLIYDMLTLWPGGKPCKWGGCLALNGANGSVEMVKSCKRGLGECKEAFPESWWRAAGQLGVDS